MNKQIYIFILSFFIYSFAGWVWESLLIHGIYMKKFVNRGFLYGPILPIYGSGALLVVLLFDIQNVEYPMYSLFLLGGFVACVLEYLTSWMMEKLFHQRWWDYSKKPFNINGRVCLEGFVAFGVFSVLAIQYIQPVFTRLLGRLSLQILIPFSMLFVVIGLIDTIKSVHIARLLAKQLGEMKIILENEEKKFRKKLEMGQMKIEELTDGELIRIRREKLSIYMKDKAYGSRRLMRAFPYIIDQRIKDVHQKMFH